MKFIKEALGDDFYNVSILNLDGVNNLQYPYFLLKDLGIPFTIVVDKDFFLPYVKNSLEDSRDSTTNLPIYSKTIHKNNPVINSIFCSDNLKRKLEIHVNESYTKFINYIKDFNILSMKYCLEMDLLDSDVACEKYYNHFHLNESDKNKKTLLKDNRKAIKDPALLLGILGELNLKDYPYSFRKIRTILIHNIKEYLV